MKPVKIAVVGAGRIGKMHIENIIQHVPQIQIKTVVDAVDQSVWVRSMNIAGFTQNLSDVLNDPEIEAVLIASSTSTHVDLIKQVAEARKHIYCEKPIAFSPEALKNIASLVKQNEIKLQVGYNRRFDPQYLEVKKNVSKGAIGEPHIVKLTNRDPERPDLAFVPNSGGLFFDFNAHDFDMVRYVTGLEVEEVYAMGDVLIDPELKKLNDIDTAAITLRLSNRAVCMIDTSRETHYGYDQRLEVFGSKGSIKANNTSPLNTELYTKEGVSSHNPHYSFIERYEHSYVQQFKEFHMAIVEDTEPLVTINDALRAVEIATAAKLSLEENRPVRVG